MKWWDVCKKIPWGTIIYSLFGLFILYNLYPSNNEESGGVGETLLALLIAIGIIIGISVAIYAFGHFFRKYSEKKKEVGKKETKEVKVVPNVPKKLTFWTDWKTWIMFVLGYILWEIGQSEQIFNGGPFHHTVPGLPEGMLYLPIAGIFYATLLGTFIYLAMHSRSPFIVTFGLLFGVVCTFASWSGHWFFPYGNIHVLTFLSGISIEIPPDLILVSNKWIALGVFCTYIMAKAFPKKGTDSDILGVMVLIAAAVMFLSQLFYL